MLFSQLDFQFLVFDFLGEGIELPVVADVFLLVGVFLDQAFGIFDHVLFGGDLVVDGLHVGLELVYPGFQTLNFIFEVFHFERELPAHVPDFVNPGIDQLQVVQGPQLVLYG